MAQVPITPERLFFKCPVCGLTLSLERHQVGVTGPCPACGASVTAPTSHPALPERSSTRNEDFRKDASRRRRGRIIADSAIDRSHLERRESFRTLSVFLWIILAFCACLLVTWFMKDWIRR